MVAWMAGVVQIVEIARLVWEAGARPEVVEFAVLRAAAINFLNETIRATPLEIGAHMGRY